MSQSIIKINLVEYDLHILELNEIINPSITERKTVPDPDDYDAGNSVLIGSGHEKQKINISGKCSLTERAIFISANKNNTKCYLTIYPPGNGTTNIIETDAYYYILSFSGMFKPGNDTDYYYYMMLAYGGV